MTNFFLLDLKILTKKQPSPLANPAIQLESVTSVELIIGRATGL